MIYVPTKDRYRVLDAVDNVVPYVIEYDDETRMATVLLPRKDSTPEQPRFLVKTADIGMALVQAKVHLPGSRLEKIVTVEESDND